MRLPRRAQSPESLKCIHRLRTAINTACLHPRKAPTRLYPLRTVTAPTLQARRTLGEKDSAEGVWEVQVLLINSGGPKVG